MSDIDYDALITDYLAGYISHEDKDVLLEWIKKSPENRAVFLSYRDAWLATSMLANRNISRADSSYREMMSGVQTYRSKRIGRMMLKIAAVFGLILLSSTASYFFYVHNQEDMQSQLCKIVVPNGSRSKVVLPDGTNVWVNAGSSLAYDNNYGIKNRDLTLDGEAYFDVFTNPEMPLVVYTHEVAVKAYGTQFNVKAYPEDQFVITTLEEGSVKIHSVDDSWKEITLKPNQALAYYKKAASQDSLRNANQQVVLPKSVLYDKVDTKLYTSWKDPEWIIRSEKLADFALALERRYNVQIHFQDNKIKNIVYSATIRNETIEEILTAMSAASPVKYYIERGNVYLHYDSSSEMNLVGN